MKLLEKCSVDLNLSIDKDNYKKTPKNLEQTLYNKYTNFGEFFSKWTLRRQKVQEMTKMAIPVIFITQMGFHT